MADKTPDRDPEIRRRAAWLLGMLALVAALFVALMVTFFNTSGGDTANSEVADPTAVPSAPATRTTSGTPAPTSSDGKSPSGTGSVSRSSTGTGGTASCPSDKPCALASDIGNAIAEINSYRAKNGRAAVPGSVSAAAAKCALSNGSNCNGGWAQTQVPAKGGKADGQAAVDKIKRLGKLLGDMKSIEVGWAYDPGNKTFFFAIVRNT